MSNFNHNTSTISKSKIWGLTHLALPYQIKWLRVLGKMRFIGIWNTISLDNRRKSMIPSQDKKRMLHASSL